MIKTPVNSLPKIVEPKSRDGGPEGSYRRATPFPGIDFGGITNVIILDETAESFRRRASLINRIIGCAPAFTACQLTRHAVAALSNA